MAFAVCETTDDPPGECALASWLLLSQISRALSDALGLLFGSSAQERLRGYLPHQHMCPDVYLAYGMGENFTTCVHGQEGDRAYQEERPP
jgi:hypothetical protein